IDKKRDRDWYAFTAKKGDVLMIDCLSHRLGSPTDIFLVLRNLATKQEFPIVDDITVPLHPIAYLTASRDPVPFRFVVPADGKYHLLVASHLADNIADPTHFYRLRITPEQPDFRLIVMPPDFYRPDACTLGAGGNETYTVFAERI